ncbi:MAG TPA: MarR family winged helix-turn-helix transcriptional regulator [Sphingomonadaceae bacterium]|nr:MarR family winged helix-turn-helix transcriptional regulator [Sphingomonadaceae bacterium]
MLVLPAEETRANAAKPRLDFAYYVPFGLTAISNKIARSASRVYLKLYGVGINEWRIVANLRVRPGITANLICQTSGLDKAAVSRSLRLLEDHGYIEADKTTNGDARGRNLRLTAKGDKLHDELIGVALAREEELLHGFTEAERRQLLSFITRMHANVNLVGEVLGPPTRRE